MGNLYRFLICFTVCATPGVLIATLTKGQTGLAIAILVGFIGGASAMPLFVEWDLHRSRKKYERYRKQFPTSHYNHLHIASDFWRTPPKDVGEKLSPSEVEKLYQDIRDSIKMAEKYHGHYHKKMEDEVDFWYGYTKEKKDGQ